MAGGLAWRRGSLRARSASLNLRRRTLAHRHGVRARRNGLRQQPVAPRPRVADAPRDARQPKFQRRTRRVGQNQAQVEISRAQPPANAPDAFTLCESFHRVNRRMAPPQFPQASRGVSSVMCASGTGFAQPQQRRRRHHRVPQPVHAPDQDALRRLAMASGFLRSTFACRRRRRSHPMSGLPPRFRVYRRDFLLRRLPPFMDPEPVGRVAAHCRLKRAVHVQHDVLHRARLAVFLRRNFIAHLDAPMSQPRAETDRRVQRQVEAQRENRRRLARACIRARGTAASPRGRRNAGPTAAPASATGRAGPPATPRLPCAAQKTGSRCSPAIPAAAGSPLRLSTRDTSSPRGTPGDHAARRARTIQNSQNGRWQKSGSSARFGVALRQHLVRAGEFQVLAGAVPRSSTAVFTAQAKFSPMRRKFSRASAGFPPAIFPRPSTSSGSGCATRRCRPSSQYASAPPARPNRATHVSGSACSTAISARAMMIKQRSIAQRKQILRTQS